MQSLQETSAFLVQRNPGIMAISNELSSEIAVAILAHGHSAQDLSKLREVLLKIHSTLQEMSEHSHPSRLRTASMRLPLPPEDRPH